MFVTLAPKILGGARDDARTIVEGPALSEIESRLKLLAVYAAQSETFLRYGIDKPCEQTL